MENMPYTLQMDRELARTAVSPSPAPEPVASDWRTGLPMIVGRTMTLRELRADDAMSLFSMLTTDEVARFISPPPTSVDGFERFIQWAARERAAGTYACFAVVPEGMDTAVGLFQVRQLEIDWATAEWGFALGSAYWGTGMFLESAEAVLAFTFGRIGVHRLEARASIKNGRGNGALRKIGAVAEGVLRRSFLRHGEYHDQSLYSILAEDWRSGRSSPRPPIH